MDALFSEKGRPANRVSLFESVLKGGGNRFPPRSRNRTGRADREATVRQRAEVEEWEKEANFGTLDRPGRPDKPPGTENHERHPRFQRTH